jgi:uncharacterized protein (DUF58 family)
MSDTVEALPSHAGQVAWATNPTRAPIRQLELTVLRRLDGLLQGDYSGLLPGHGTEIGEARPYLPGDDPRRIDWAVTARTNEPHVRDTISDHELELWLAVDTSASLAFGTARSEKRDLAWAAAGAFALLASRGGNRIGAVTTTAPRKVFPARGGRAHVGAVLSALHREPADGDRGDLAGALGAVHRNAHRRGMVVAVSDFLEPDRWARPLRALAQRHDVVAVEVVDPRELTLPDVGLLTLVDPETGRQRTVDTHSPKLRRAFEREAAVQRDAIAGALASTDADHLRLSTDRDWVVDLVGFVGRRKARRSAARGGRR